MYFGFGSGGGRMIARGMGGLVIRSRRAEVVLRIWGWRDGTLAWKVSLGGEACERGGSVGWEGRIFFDIRACRCGTAVVKIFNQMLKTSFLTVTNKIAPHGNYISRFEHLIHSQC